MPCFQGLAVSIHTPDGPLPEYSIQKNSRIHRITSYIPVPTPKIERGSTRPEPSTFAISITLLTPGIAVPYSTPKPTADDPYPRPKLVSGQPSDGASSSKSASGISPYKPISASQNETIAAYIYFDGRPKEEVATLLRRGEETWVNSRWVSVPETEGGGLAEREFLFREVGLERWLNGLDLKGRDQDIAAKIEKRRQKLERKRKVKVKSEMDSSDDETVDPRRERKTVLRYGDDKNAPVETISPDDSLSDDSDSDDDPPMPEAAGQIKVALYRVLASGEIKRGEYSPQFDAHDDDDLENGPRDDTNADVDHTTSFAKPKTLDPKTISTQTVTGIDPPEKPYAVFTFLYRGQRQLQKMGILPGSSQPKTSAAAKRKSGTIDFSAIKPLKEASTVKNFAGYRDAKVDKDSLRKLDFKTNDDDMDSDADDDDAEEAMAKDDDKDDVNPNRTLTAEDADRQERLAEGVKKINLLKRQASSEPLGPPSPSTQTKPSPSLSTTAAGDSTPDGPTMNGRASLGAGGISAALAAIAPSQSTDAQNSSSSGMDGAGLSLSLSNDAAATIGSPFKRARASQAAADGSPVDVSAAKKASAMFGSIIGTATAAPMDADEAAAAPSLTGPARSPLAPAAAVGGGVAEDRNMDDSDEL